MCDPVSGTLAVVSALSTAYGISEQNKQAAYQRANAESQNAAALENYRTQARQMNLQAAEEADAASEEKMQQRMMAEKAIATQRVSTAEAGISGLVVDSIFSDVLRQAGQNISTIDRNLANSGSQRDQQIKALRTNTGASLVDPRQFRKTSALAAGLQIASSAGSTYVASGGKLNFSGTQAPAPIVDRSFRVST